MACDFADSRKLAKPINKMAFLSEKELHQTLAYSDIFSEREYDAAFIRSEVPVGNCIPDLVYVMASKFPKIDIWPKNDGCLHSFIFSLLRSRNRLHPQTIANLCYERLDAIQSALEDLEGSQAIEKLPTGALTLSYEMRNIEAEIISCEVKLNRWREALDQAEKYKRFSDRVFVALDADKKFSESKVINEYKSKNVGLCLVSPSSIDWLIFPPLVSGSRNPEKEYLISSASGERSQTLWKRL